MNYSGEIQQLQEEECCFAAAVAASVAITVRI